MIAGHLRKPGLINGAVALGLLLGPGLGALVAATLGGMANASGEYFGFYLATSGVYGYLITLPVFLPVMLLLRHLRQDDLMLCTLIGFLIGFAFYKLVLGAPIRSSEMLSVAVDGALPFAFMLGAVRLIAGPRT
ncbi:MAG: hypothetical protein AB7P20_20540 [Rhizobiaceae bacterium]